MTQRIEISTMRLLLRPFRLDDAERVQQLAADFDIANTTLRIPHPYPKGAAEEWIAGHKQLIEKSIEFPFAIILKKSSELIGAISLMPDIQFNNAELGYWIGKPFWKNGYATEAGKAMLNYGFEEFDFNRIHAHHFGSNPASGKVLQKIGMRPEGILRQHVKKGDRYEDAVMYGILKSE